jgi:hypothetical protein
LKTLRDLGPQKHHERRGCPDASSYEEALKDLWGEEVAKGGEDAYPLP